MPKTGSTEVPQAVLPAHSFLSAGTAAPVGDRLEMHHSCRRTDPISTSMSGSDDRPTLRKRSNSTSWSGGLAVTTNNAGLTIEPASPDPRATTSWLHAGELASRCPYADVQPEHLVVTDTG